MGRTGWNCLNVSPKIAFNYDPLQVVQIYIAANSFLVKRQRSPARRVNDPSCEQSTWSPEPVTQMRSLGSLVAQ